ncbi:MAG: molybdopterin molybdotransferase MoeA [Candidatus Hydrogenedentes bacterium]|nr:molybdopterin molybdotransferase MoeA [Candidatus Hydrogenedentota bacterium]
MISRKEALRRITAAAWCLPTTPTPLEEANGRILAEDVMSDIDIPPFDKSSMDGYACRAADAAGPLRVLEHIPAGRVPTKTIAPGTCSKIMTGAPVPDGADCILIVEQVESIDDDTIRFTGTTTKSNICLKAEDVRIGDRVLRAGTRLGPQHVPVLASVGYAHPLLASQPRVAVMATGDELVPASEPPAPGKIRNSNSVQLAALAVGAGGIATDLGIVPDEMDAMAKAWEDALTNHDVVLSTGGVSMGDYDLVPDILKHLGFDIHFDRVAVQPGKPVLFGTRGQQACFGLSGNPASSFLQFNLFVAPFLWHLQGGKPPTRIVPLPLGHTFTRRNGAREGWVPVQIDDSHRVVSVAFHGSAHIHSFTAADGLIAFPAGETTLKTGSTAMVHFFSR